MLTLLFLLVLAAVLVFILPSQPTWLTAIILAVMGIGWFFLFRRKRHKLGFVLSFLALLCLTWAVVQLNVVQNWLVKKAADRLSESLKTKVEVKHVDFSLFNKMNIEGVLVEDLKHDTLLYAGELNVRITDWFFFKDRAVLHYIGLNDARINLNRTDATWNYQFLIDFFSSPKKSTGSKKASIEFNLEKAAIHNLHFFKNDKWVGKDIELSAKTLVLDAEQLDFSSKNLLINSLTLDEPVYAESRYTGNRPAGVKTSVPIADTAVLKDTAKFQWNNDGWLVNLTKLTIRNGKISIEKETERKPYTDRFDGQHLLFSQLNGDLDQIHFEKDTLTSRIHFTAVEKSGLDVKKLDALLKFNPGLMEFNQLDLVLNHSHLKNYYAMRFNDFLSDFDNFIHDVSLEGRFENSIVSSDDIAIFAPALKSWKKTFDLNGVASGPVDNLAAKKMRIKSGATIVDGDIALRGLPDINETFIDFKGNDVQTNYADLTSFVPSLRNTKGILLSRLGAIRYKGNFTGFVNDFVTYGTFNTALGTVTGDLNMKLPEAAPARYSGKISTAGFNLGQFTGKKELGNIAVDGKIVGSGFTQKELQANFKGSFRDFYFSGNNYQNIALDAGFKNKQFSGTGSINDPNLKIDQFNGSVDFSKSQPVFNFDAVVPGANLKKLKITNQDFQVAGNLKINFTGGDIDNFLGTARITNASLKHDGKLLSFDSLILKSQLLPDNKKQLTLGSNEVDASITGNFKILELPDAFNYFLSNYYPAYIRKPTRKLSEQDFDFSIHTKNIDEYTQLLDKKLKGFDNTDITGRLDLTGKLLNLDAKIPSFIYDEKVFSGINLKANGNADSLYTSLHADNIKIGDSLQFPGTQINLTSNKDLTTVAVKTSASKTLSKAELNATVQTYSDGVKVHFSPSSFIVNEKLWELEKDGELVVRNSVFDASQVKFVQGEQQIVISTDPSGTTNGTDLLIALKDININDATSLLNVKNPRVEGELTGTLRISEPFSKRRRFEFEDGSINNLVLNNSPFGKVGVNNVTLGKDGILNFDLKTAAENQQSDFNITGKINLNDTVRGNKIDIALHSRKLSIEFLEPYLSGIFSDMTGNAVGDITWTGTDDHQDLTGTVFVTDGSFKVNYTQCRYKFTNQTLLFNPGEIDFGKIVLKDTLNNTGIVTGRLFHKFFKDFNFDNIHMQTGRMLLMNTTKKDNSAFYGKIIGNADMSINGPVNNMLMKIVGGPSAIVKDSNHLYLPTESSRDAGNIDYMEFVQFGSIMENELNNKEGTNIVLDMYLEANPACKVDVILDESTSDIIKGEGSGQLHIKVGNKENLSITGTYVIESGQYVFNFKDFLQKGFSLKSGGSITWDNPDDPYDAKINIDAEYTATKVDFSSLPSIKGNTVKSDINIVSHLARTLKNPKINFEFELPEGSYYSQDILVKSKLADFAVDDNEMNKQVSSVLIFNSFSSQGLFKNQNPYGLAFNTIGQIIFRDLTDFINNKYLQRYGITLNLDVSSSNNDLNGLNRNLQAAAIFGLTYKVVNGRIIFTVGGNLDVNNPYVTNPKSAVLLTPDFTAEFLLNKDGKFRLIAFRRTNTDFTFGQQTKNGVRLSYKKDFNNWYDLFHRYR